MLALASLDLFWKKAKVSLKWKLEVYNAVVVSKLIYGLETLQFNNSTFNKINTFQMKGLRKIMNIPPTFIDRSTTDDMVFNICNEEIAKNSKSKYPTKVIRLSEILKRKRLTLLGHVIRCENTDPMRKSVFRSDTTALVNFESEKQRGGHPRMRWIDETMKDAWECIRKKPTGIHRQLYAKAKNQK